MNMVCILHCTNDILSHCYFLKTQILNCCVFADHALSESVAASCTFEEAQDQATKRQISSSHNSAQPTNISQIAQVTSMTDCATDVKSLSS